MRQIEQLLVEQLMQLLSEQATHEDPLSYVPKGQLQTPFNNDCPDLQLKRHTPTELATKPSEHFEQSSVLSFWQT